MKKMRKNYRDTISEIKKSGKKPRWMGESVWQGWLRYWEMDEAKASILIFFELLISRDRKIIYQILNVQAESDRNSANRNKNPVTHRGGSKSFQQYRQELVNLLNNKCK